MRLPDPPGGATDLQGALDAIAARFAADDGRSTSHVVASTTGVLRLHLDGPTKRNALDDDDGGRRSSTRSTPPAATRRCAASSLTGEGDHFCGGFDIVGRNDGDRRRGPGSGSIQRRLPSRPTGSSRCCATVQVPVVCAAAGWAAGIGLHLARGRRLHRRRRRRHAFWEPFSQRGFTPDSGGTWLLPRLRRRAARPRAARCSARELDGAEAAEWGLVHRAVPGRRGRRRGRGARRRSSPRARRSPSASQVAAAHRRPSTRSTQHLRDEAFAHRAVVAQRGLPRGPAAFSEKRDPGVQGPMSDRSRPATLDADGGRRGDVAAGGRARARGVARRPRPGRRGRDPRGAHAAPSTRRGTRRSRASGLVVPTWPVEYGGLDVDAGTGARASRPSCARTTSAGSTRSGSTWPRRRCSPTAPRSSGCGSCRRSCATRRCGASCSASRAPAPTSRRWPRGPSATATSGCSPARRCGPRGRTSPTSACAWPAPTPTCRSARASPTSCVDLHQPGVEVRPLRHISGEVDFNEVFLDGARVPDAQRVGDVGDGWRVANATLSGERQMVSGAGSGGVDRIGGVGRRPARSPRGADRRTRSLRQRLVAPVQRGAHPGLDEPAGAGRLKAGRSPGPRARSARCTRASSTSASSSLAADLLGARAPWRGTAGDDGSLPLRGAGHAAQPGQHDRGRHHRGEQERHRRAGARAAREPDPWHGAPWQDVPRS